MAPWDHLARFVTRSRSMPLCRPSTSAAWISNSEQCWVKKLRDSVVCQKNDVDGCVTFRHVSRNSAGRCKCIPSEISVSVTVCHLFMATNQRGGSSEEDWRRRQDRSMTNLDLSPLREARMRSRLSWEKRPEGNKNEVSMIYCRAYGLASRGSISSMTDNLKQR